MIAGVYQILNTITGQIYIGSTINFQKRKNSHLSFLRRGRHVNKKLQNSFSKYGEQFFQFTIIDECLDLQNKEQYYIDLLNPYYNLFKTAYSVTGSNHPMFGRKHTPEARQKIKEARAKQTISHSAETKAKIGAKNKGKLMPEGHLKKLIESRTKPVWNKGLKTGIAPANKILLNDSVIIEMYNKGHSVEHIRLSIGVSWGTVKRVLLESGVKTRTLKQANKIRCKKLKN